MNKEYNMKITKGIVNKLLIILSILLFIAWTIITIKQHKQHKSYVTVSGTIVAKWSSHRSSYHEMGIIPDSEHTTGANTTFPVGTRTYGMYEKGNKIRIRIPYHHVMPNLYIFNMAIHSAVSIVMISCGIYLIGCFLIEKYNNLKD
jgi:hypothetical protein